MLTIIVGQGQAEYRIHLNGLTLAEDAGSALTNSPLRWSVILQVWSMGGFRDGLGARTRTDKSLILLGRLCHAETVGRIIENKNWMSGEMVWSSAILGQQVHAIMFA